MSTNERRHEIKRHLHPQRPAAAAKKSQCWTPNLPQAVKSSLRLFVWAVRCVRHNIYEFFKLQKGCFNEICRRWANSDLLHPKRALLMQSHWSKSEGSLVNHVASNGDGKIAVAVACAAAAAPVVFIGP